MKWVPAVALALALSLALSPSARAQALDFFSFPLDSQQVVPGPGGPGFGWAVFYVFAEEVRGEVYVVSSEVITSVHIHGPGGFGAEAPELVALPVTHAGTTPISVPMALTSEQRGWLRGWRCYVDVHTVTHPNGSLRGQVGEVAIVPSTWSRVRQLYR